MWSFLSNIIIPSLSFLKSYIFFYRNLAKKMRMILPISLNGMLFSTQFLSNNYCSSRMLMLSSSSKLFLSFCPVCVHVCEWIVLPILYEEKQKLTTISKSVIIGRPANLLIDCKYRLNEAHNNHEYIVLSIRKIDLIRTTLKSQIGLIEMK